MRAFVVQSVTLEARGVAARTSSSSSSSLDSCCSFRMRAKLIIYVVVSASAKLQLLSLTDHPCESVSIRRSRGQRLGPILYMRIFGCFCILYHTLYSASQTSFCDHSNCESRRNSNQPWPAPLQQRHRKTLLCQP